MSRKMKTNSGRPVEYYVEEIDRRVFCVEYMCSHDGVPVTAFVVARHTEIALDYIEKKTGGDFVIGVKCLNYGEPLELLLTEFDMKKREKTLEALNA